MVRRAEVPTYPGLGLAAGMTGTVRVQVTVRKGTVSGTIVLASTGFAAFVPSTLANIKTWEFEDAIDTTFVTTFTYEMTDMVTEELQNPRVELDLPYHVRLIGSRPKTRTIRDAAPIRVDPPQYQVSSAAMRRAPNKRLKLAARVDYGMSFSSARRSLSAVR